MWCIVRRGASLCASGARTYARSVRSTNPGMQRRARALEQSGVSLPTDGDLDEMLEESEPDMQNAHLSFNQHVRETRQQRDTLRHQIVRQKYMDEQMPNLLTWSEKEQIRYLASEHPDEWTPERIAESFPVTASVVKKLLKFPWKPSSMERISRHDASAMRNWRELKEGTLDLPPDLREHFLKFSDRSIPPLKETSVKREITQEQMGEFQLIIEKCAKSDEKEERKEENLQIGDSKTSNLDPKRLTLDRLKERITTRLAAGKDVDVSDRVILSSGLKDDPAMPVSESEYAMERYTVKDEALSQLKEDPKEIEPAIYPDRIRIPKSAWKKGGTYKVNDCYYDDDGRFLYRVLGMN